MNASTPKLVPRLVPQPLFGLSGYHKLRRSEWEAIRRVVIADASGACQICGASQPKGMIVDEVWFYMPGMATLVGLQLLCPRCNNVIHSQNALARGVPEEAIVAHCAAVNGVDETAAASLIAEARAAWGKLHSSPTWGVMVVPEVLERFPALSVLHGVVA